MIRTGREEGEEGEKEGKPIQNSEVILRKNLKTSPLESQTHSSGFLLCTVQFSQQPLVAALLSFLIKTVLITFFVSTKKSERHLSRERRALPAGSRTLGGNLHND